MRNRLVLGLAISVLSAPASAATCDVAAITPGMGQADVITACGQPDTRYSIGAITKLIWQNSPGVFDIVWMTGGKVRNAAHTHN